MTHWKVIFATLVIFCSGLAVGALIAKRTFRAAATVAVQSRGTNSPATLWPQHRDFVRRMERELNLTPVQKESIDKVLKQSQERIKTIRVKIAPDMREELKIVRDQIRAQLNPEQQQKFEEALKAKPTRKLEDAKDDLRKKTPKENRRPRPGAFETNSVLTNAP